MNGPHWRRWLTDPAPVDPVADLNALRRAWMLDLAARPAPPLQEPAPPAPSAPYVVVHDMISAMDRLIAVEESWVRSPATSEVRLASGRVRLTAFREMRKAALAAAGISEDGPGERAYLVRGLPMPGERVRHTSGRVGEVVGPGQLSGAWPSMHVRDEDGDTWWALVDITPHYPEAERLRVATEAVRKTTNGWVKNSEEVARAVLDALKEVDDG